MNQSTEPVPTTYSNYLMIENLLSLQQCRSIDPDTGEPEHDETLFIIIHQVYELWFKQVLHELDAFAEYLNQDAPAKGGHQLKRVLKILKTLVAQLDVLETMTPLEFASFRSFLDTASGFQSAQFRELEFLLGQKSSEHLHRFESNDRERTNLTRRYRNPALWDVFLRYLSRQGYPIPTEILERDLSEPVVESAEVQQVLIDVYRERPYISEMCEALIDFDEGVQEWRYRHVMMVQRTIGTRGGTGGSTGAEYLRTTLFRPAFPDLWAIRSLF